MDAWILLLNREVSGEFNRELYLLKARGLSHSNQVREFIMSEKESSSSLRISEKAAPSPVPPGRTKKPGPGAPKCGVERNCRKSNSRSSKNGGVPRPRWKRCRQNSMPTR